jgi:hypothetical protein
MDNSNQPFSKDPKFSKIMVAIDGSRKLDILMSKKRMKNNNEIMYSIVKLIRRIT